ncbi:MULTISPECIES: oligosaccharide flippase family protein [Acinetobacter]|uniref:oligosaccharide flippase family protein n=1 Tax=Acinetobacter TaxID=469 RepID=UPI00039B9B2E|nr:MULTISPECIES: oligosaccharide flippase family protein [Acinetobacter]MCM1935638.1 oligosaccharide flippase family protein [Acinetobacter radioresistens]MCM1953475.1 oligosaccharide flippase family protein [Acinetobacter radioresistens]MDU4031665.1 oligosaccharide flippase family protein [Acinetobacter sp.]
MNFHRVFQSYVKDSLIILLGTLLGSLFAFLNQTLIARNLTVAEYGIFSTQLTLLNFLAPCIGMGISAFWLKVYGEEQKNAVRWMPVSLKLVTLTSGIIVGLILLNALTSKDLSFFILLFFSLYCFGQSIIELVGSKYQIDLNYRKFSIIQLIPHGLRFFLVLIIIAAGEEGLINFMVAYGISGFLITVFGAKDLINFLKQKTSNHKSEIIEVSDLFKKSLPFWSAGFLYLIYVQSAVLILNFLVGAEQAGYYSAAFIFLASVYIIPSVIYQKFLLPQLHKWAYHDNEKITKVYSLGNKLMFFIGSTFLIALFFSSNFLVDLIYSDSYENSVLIIKILCFAIPFKFISSSVGAILSTKGYVGKKVKIMLIASIFNVLMNFILIYYFSSVGAAIVTVLTEIILMTMLMALYKLSYARKL